MKNELRLPEAEFQQPEHPGSAWRFERQTRFRAIRDRLLAWAFHAVMSISPLFL
jgi:hypothetical protein